jgi:rfaE bifunctional protein nucleotidyltransferase chain/domain
VSTTFRAVALLDRDGTIIEDRGYLREADGVALLPGAAEAIRLLNDEGIACVVTTNQSGIARGRLTEADVHAQHERLRSLLAEAAGARLDAIYFCAAHPDDSDPRRKPGIGMYQDAVRDLGLAGLPVFAIGDRGGDADLGVNAGGVGILVGHSPEAETLPPKSDPALWTRAQDLRSAAEWLLMALCLREHANDEALQRKACSLEEAGRRAAALRAQGRVVVLANGCFDLLHGGHVSYLEGAREAGDYLVLAVNSNLSIRALKGPGRPILREADRLQLLAALECVDAVTVFHERSADRALALVRPDIHAKGTDYTLDSMPERETAQRLGIRMVIAGAAKENSTRDIIATVRERAEEGLV